MKTYAISALVDQFNKQLSTKQRASSLFSEAPVIAGKVLRRGVELILNEAQYLQHNSKINVLVSAGSIKVRVIAEDGQLRAETSSSPSPLTNPTVEVSGSGPAAGVIDPEVVKGAVDLATDTAKEVISAVAPEMAAAVDSSSSQDFPRKGRKAKGSVNESL